MTIARRDLLSGMAMAVPALYASKAFGRPCSAQAQFGVQTYSFRDMLPTEGDMIDKMIVGCREIGVDMIELFEPTIEPPALSSSAPWAVKTGKITQASLYGRPPEGPKPEAELRNREDIRKWRMETPLAQFVEIGHRFRSAGITVQAFNFGLKDDCTDAEVDKGFMVAKALGTDLMTASTTLTMAKRTVPFAARHGIYLGLHGHSNLHDANQFATPESFDEGLAMSPWYRLNFDIGHFAAAGFDTLAFLEKHKSKIVSVHFKDRKKNLGPNEPFGQGDTPIADVLRYIRSNCLPIPMMLEYEYDGGSSVKALREMLQYCHEAWAQAPLHTL
ncbi:sugar phosphate isomerase/epimerase [Novosphingobium sp. 1949]|uniref:Sugar phosphate isomerase/epimerase n=1 Tax=Novosphingobium organovorum TaxID=2930092 RepID=A0ABT0BBL5_9SPHN|nr:TIM barrel protein [Novosphingobium organovorum]MCJ2182450.1 sugar phosphate isomerase/epimerase [Novosphingobium organovorum]